MLQTLPSILNLATSIFDQIFIFIVMTFSRFRLTVGPKATKI